MSKVGEVKVPSDTDFETFKRICESDEGWAIEHKTSTFKVWTKANNLSQFKMIRAQMEYDNVSADLLYDVIQDGEYRAVWDDKMSDFYEICYVAPNSYIEYYGLKFPRPLKNRDFVTQRCWLDLGEGKEKIVFNHSVNHAKCPPKKGVIRGISFLTATYIKPTSHKSCMFYYVTQADPGSSLPPWMINTATKIFAPKMFKRLTKALLKYDKWKAKHNPNHKPWSNPEQCRMPRIDWNDILPLDFATADPDESKISEKDIDEKIEAEDD